MIEQIKDCEIPPNPHEYNSYIAALWRLATNNDPVEILLGSLLGSTIGGLLPPAVDVTIYDNLRVENGQFKPSYDLVSSSGAPPAPDSGELTGLNYLSAYTSDLYRLFRQPAALTAAAQAGQERVALEQQADQDGFRAEKSFRAGRNQDGATTRISTRVNVPSESRVADTLAAKQLGVVADTSIRSAPVEGQNVPGDITLTDSPDSSSDGTAPPAPPGSQVNGATSTGQVQGITDGLTGIGSVVGGLAAYYDLGRLPQDVSSNIAPAHDEEGLAATLTGFNPGFSEDGSAGWPSVLNQLIDAASN